MSLETSSGLDTAKQLLRCSPLHTSSYSPVPIKRLAGKCSGVKSRSSVRCKISTASSRSLIGHMQLRKPCVAVLSSRGTNRKVRKERTMTECPQCGTANEDDVKNCKGCRINMYWAFQHYEELANIRQANRLATRPETAAFLVETSKKIDAGPTVGWLRTTIKK